ncbi:hypothetical protein Tco_0942440 [Tanacetum coccineum]
MKQTYHDWPSLGGGYVPRMLWRMLHNMHASEDVALHQRVLLTRHASEYVAYHACFGGCCLPCMLQRMLPIQHASEDAAYQACFEGCCIPCMLRRMMPILHASEDVAYHACFGGCCLQDMIKRIRHLVIIFASRFVRRGNDTTNQQGSRVVKNEDLLKQVKELQDGFQNQANRRVAE